ncbi:MAG: hypothetical protein ACP5VF_11525 [Acidobacteriota bacterium]
MTVRMLRRLTMIFLIGLLGLSALAPALRRAPRWLCLSASVVQGARFSGGGNWDKRAEDHGCAIRCGRSSHTIRREQICGESPALFFRPPARRSDRLMRTDRSFFAWVQAQGNTMRRRIFKKQRQV